MTRTLRYQFTPAAGPARTFTVTLDPAALANLTPPLDPAPEWTRLSYQQCPNCPLDPATHPACPTAVHLAGVVAGFSETHSFEEAEIRVETPERTFLQRTTVQRGLSSLLGIYMATAGCPILDKLRPMVRFHLPFASEEETLFRAASMYLVGQYLKAEEGGVPDWSLKGLAEIYRAVGAVNRAFATRLRVAVKKDANLNAIIVLDTFAKAFPDVIDDRLHELRYLFSSWE